MKFSAFDFGEKITTGRAAPPKARMALAGQATGFMKPPAAYEPNPANPNQQLARRMHAESDEWYTNLHTGDTVAGAAVGGGGGAVSDERAAERQGRNMAAYTQANTTQFVRSSSAYGQQQQQATPRGGGSASVLRSNSATVSRVDPSALPAAGAGGLFAANNNNNNNRYTHTLGGGGRSSLIGGGMAALGGGIPMVPRPASSGAASSIAVPSNDAGDSDDEDYPFQPMAGSKDARAKGVASLNPQSLAVVGTPMASTAGAKAQPQQGGGGAALQRPLLLPRDRNVVGTAPYPMPNQLRQPVASPYAFAMTAAGTNVGAATFADPTLGVSIPRTRALNRGSHPMYRSITSQAYGNTNTTNNTCSMAQGQGGGGGESEDPFAPIDDPHDRPPAAAGVRTAARNANNLLAYDEEWVPRAGGGQQRVTTATATTTQGGVPLAATHTADDRRPTHKSLEDNVVQRVGGPAPTSIGAAALEAIRKEKRYRVKVTQMVADLEAECASVGGRLGSSTTAANSSKAGRNNGIPLISAGGPIQRQAQLMERLDTIQGQVRAKVTSRAGPASTFEQRARMLQSMLEQYGGVTNAATALRSNTLLPMGAARGHQQQQQQIPTAAVSNIKPIGVVPGQPQQSIDRTVARGYNPRDPFSDRAGAGGATPRGSITTSSAAPPAAVSEITADQLVAALRQGFAIPITADEADAFIDHCDVDEKGSVSVKEVAEGVMAGGSVEEGTSAGTNAQIESVLLHGANSPHAPFYKASDVFAYLRRRRLGALADPSIRRIILSIKARLLERSIANTRHLTAAQDSLASVGSMRAYLVMILTRFPTTKAVASPEAYYERLRQHELAQQRADEEEQQQAMAMQQQRYVYGGSAPTNPITGAGSNPYATTAATASNTMALRYGRGSTAYNNANNPITNNSNVNGYGARAQPQRAAANNISAVPPLPHDLLEQQVIAPADLLNGLQSIGVRGITMAEVEALLRATNTPDGIAPKAFVGLMRGMLPRRRRRIIREVFDYLDLNKDGVLTVEEVMGNFDASQHPAVLIGEATAETIKAQFMTCWLRDANGDGAIDWSEFLATYKDLSDEIENDDYFELMMRNVWHLSGGSTLMATNTTCRRVLVTFIDGSQRVEEIKNDIGIRAKDKDTMIRRLEQQGCRGIKTVELYA